MIDNKQKFTRLTLEQNDLKVVWEVPYDDVCGDDMMQAIRTIMIGMTFRDSTIESAMAEYINDHSDKYKIISVQGLDETLGYDVLN